MRLRNDPTGYGAVSQTLHWLVAVLMLAAFLLGERLEELPRGPDKLTVLGWHLLIGSAVLGLVLVRLAWRRADPPPQDTALPLWQQYAAKAVHLGLYVLMLGLPLTGLLAVLTGGRPISVLGLVELPALVSVPWLHEAAEEVHGVGSKALLLLVGAHVLATLWHALVRRDGVAARMLPFAQRHVPAE